MSRVVHFEIPADDTTRCARFYREVFGWVFQNWEGPQEYWLVSTGTGGRGIDGGMMKRMNPQQGTVNTVEVESVDDAVARIRQHGGSVTVPKVAIPGVGWLAYCADTEANTFGVMQPDEAAR